ncbi:terminase small subunit [Salmonella enterica]|uniref:terminase small subunit n=1 Tax=Salmonella enterica TaxID=28901 RepID=UPI001078308E|nr:terminase small subunit [Salmonella enterica]EAA8256864.1 terminase small subunit [Salmonella enterica subsp. enterica]EDB4177678.1 terminase small subunit [Salmonella enterica subsp. enterica serovar Poona]EAW0924773.1 terminase small subunit [Salmonella enterica]EBA4614515.1 terminase small subunit [Salmonella enterica]EBP4392275.1 terminase small subunit [Salmonella enterica subsp. enterica]
MAKLTDKQELFAREYLKDLNATQAAIRAGYSEKTANEQASRLLANVNVQSFVAELKATRIEQTGIDAAYVLRRLVEIDQMDVLDILLSNGELKPIKDWPKTWRTTLSGIDVTETAGDTPGLLKKIKWPDKVKNLELLGKHVTVQAFKEQTATEITGANGGPVRYADMSEELLEEKLKELGNGRRSNQLESKRSDL